MGSVGVWVRVRVGMKTTEAQRADRALVRLTHDHRGKQCFQTVERLTYRETLNTTAH